MTSTRLKRFAQDLRFIKSNNNHNPLGRFDFGEGAKALAKKHGAILMSSVFAIPNNDFEFARLSYSLPPLCKKAQTLIRVKDNRRVLLKRSVLERQAIKHREIGTPLKNKATLYNALYCTGEMIYRGWKDREFYYALMKGESGAYYSCVVDTNPNNDFIEIVDWRIVDEYGYKNMKKQQKQLE